MGVMVDGKRKIWYQDISAAMDLGSDILLQVSPTEFMKYLGLHFGVFPKKKFDPWLLVPQLTNLTRAFLKPQLHLFILINYLLPIYFQQLMLGKIYFKPLGTMDKLVRKYVSRWLPLARDAPVPFFHASGQAAGLEIPSLLGSVPIWRGRR